MELPKPMMRDVTSGTIAFVLPPNTFVKLGCLTRTACQKYRRAVIGKKAPSLTALLDNNTRWAWESLAYADELSIARRPGRHDIDNELMLLRNEEWQRIFMPHRIR
ncbi:MAG: hypothetical protein ACO1RA_06825 [Planctomycetaceae bacterium]